MDEGSREVHDSRAGRLRRAGHLAAHGLGAAFALGTAILATLFLMVGGGGLRFDAFHSPIEQAIANKTGARTVSIGELRFVRDRAGANPFKFTITDLNIDQGDGNLVSLPSISIRLAGAALAKGLITPRFVEVDGASVIIDRRGDDLKVSGSLDIRTLLQLASEMSRVHGAGFEGAVLNDFSVTYTDLEAGTQFQAHGGTASLRETDGDYDFDLLVPFADVGGEPGSLSLTAETEAIRGRVDAALVFDNAPGAQLLNIFLARTGRVVIDAPVSGEVTAEGSLFQGAALLNIDLSIGEGAFKSRNMDIPVTALSINGTHDIRHQNLNIESLNFDVAGVAGQLSGDVSYKTLSGSISELLFALKGEQIVASLGELFDGPVPIDRLETEGRYNIAARTIELSKFEADYYEATINGTAAADFGHGEGGVPAISTSLAVDGALTPQQVLRGWPVPAGDGARRWVVANMPDARVSGVTFDLSLPPGAFTGEELHPEAIIDLKFRVDDATVIYAPGMTPVTDLSATARINGNSFAVKTEHGRLGDIRITGGNIDMPRLVPEGAPATYVSEFEGELSDILGIIDEEPLGYVSMAGLSPGQFGGRGQFRLEIMRPMLEEVPLSDYRFSGEGGFRDLSLTLFGDRLPLTEGTGSVTMQPDGLTVTGLANAFGTPSSFQWHRPFGTDIVQTVTADTKINPRAADAYGIPLRRFVRGDLAVRIDAEGDNEGFENFRVIADLTPAMLILEDGRLLKQSGTEGEARMTIQLPEDVPLMVVPQIKMSVPGANIEGSARFTREGALVDLDLPRFWIEEIADFALKISRDDRRVKLSVIGEYANASGAIDKALSFRTEGGDRLPGGIDLDVLLNRVEMKAGAILTGVKLTGHHNGAELERLNAFGNFPGGGALSLELKENDQGLGEDIILETDRFGTMLRGVFGIESVTGGEARMTATLIDEGPMAGQFTASNIVLRNAPVVAQLLSIGSLDGLANVLNGEGLEFSSLGGDIQLADGKLALVDARLTGSALGMSANGTIDLNDSVFDLHGAVAPAYRVNSFMGGLPGLGDLFVSREGEGVFALAYRIDGPMSAATIEVNTLAALTPGIFRRIFEPVDGDLPSTAELLTEAEKAAGDAAARDFLSTPELLQEYERQEAERAQAQGQN